MNYYTASPEELKNAFRAHLGESITVSDLSDQTKYSNLDTVMLKYDGWWTCLRAQHGIMEVITSGAEVRRRIAIPDNIAFVSVSEWMYGTQWAGAPDRAGNFYIQDTAMLGNTNITHLHHRDRHEAYSRYFAVNSIPHINIMAYWTRALALQLWIDNPHFEGIVLKDGSTFGNATVGQKLKHPVDDDFVIMSINEGGGRLRGTCGSVTGGKYKNGVLIAFVSASGLTDSKRSELWANRDSYIGRVFKVIGKAKFASGSIRHPQWGGFREDKLPEDCIA